MNQTLKNRKTQNCLYQKQIKKNQEHRRTFKSIPTTRILIRTRFQEIKSIKRSKII
jgi:hypothetical protein